MSKNFNKLNIIYISDNERKLNTNNFLNKFYYFFYKLTLKKFETINIINEEKINTFIDKITYHFEKLLIYDIYTINICDELKSKLLELDNKFSNKEKYKYYYINVIIFRKMLENIILLKQLKNNKDYDETTLSFVKIWTSEIKKNLKTNENFKLNKDMLDKIDKLNNLIYISKLNYIINEVLLNYEKNISSIYNKFSTQFTIFKFDFTIHLKKLINNTKYNNKIFNKIFNIFLNNDEDVLNKKITKFNYDILFILKIFLYDIIILNTHPLNESEERYLTCKKRWISLLNNVTCS